MSNTITMTQTSSPLITIDTDNLTVRVYHYRAVEAGMSEDAIRRLTLDGQAIACALTSLTGSATSFSVVRWP